MNWISRSRLSALEAALLTAAFSTAGATLGWWTPALVAAPIGYLKHETSKLGLKLSAISSLAWLVPAVALDIEARGQISRAIAGLAGPSLHLNGYLLTLLVPCLLAGLGSSFGSCCREMRERMSRSQSAHSPAAETRSD